MGETHANPQCQKNGQARLLTPRKTLAPDTADGPGQQPPLLYVDRVGFTSVGPLAEAKRCTTLASSQHPQPCLPLWRNAILPVPSWCRHLVGNQTRTSRPKSEQDLSHHICATRPSPSPRVVSGLLTLFSKFFATFACATCLLSVCRWYLALAGIHLPSLHCTLKQCDSAESPCVGSRGIQERGYHPLWRCVPTDLP